MDDLLSFLEDLPIGPREAIIDKLPRVMNNKRIKVCGVEVDVDMYAMPSRGEGYPIILGRLWLIAMKAKKDWETGVLELNQHRQGGRRGKAILYNMKEGRQENLELETSVDESSSSSLGSTEEEDSTKTEEESSMEVMGVILKEQPRERLERNLSESSKQSEEEIVGQQSNSMDGDLKDRDYFSFVD